MQVGALQVPKAARNFARCFPLARQGVNVDRAVCLTGISISVNFTPTQTKPAISSLDLLTRWGYLCHIPRSTRWFDAKILLCPEGWILDCFFSIRANAMLDTSSGALIVFPNLSQYCKAQPCYDAGIRTCFPIVPLLMLERVRSFGGVCRSLILRANYSTAANCGK